MIVIIVNKKFDRLFISHSTCNQLIGQFWVTIRGACFTSIIYLPKVRPSPSQFAMSFTDEYKKALCMDKFLSDFDHFHSLESSQENLPVEISP